MASLGELFHRCVAERNVQGLIKTLTHCDLRQLQSRDQEYLESLFANPQWSDDFDRSLETQRVPELYYKRLRDIQRLPYFPPFQNGARTQDEPEQADSTCEDEEWHKCVSETATVAGKGSTVQSELAPRTNSKKSQDFIDVCSTEIEQLTKTRPPQDATSDATSSCIVS